MGSSFGDCIFGLGMGRSPGKLWSRFGAVLVALALSWSNAAPAAPAAPASPTAFREAGAGLDADEEKVPPAFRNSTLGAPGRRLDNWLQGRSSASDFYSPADYANLIISYARRRRGYFHSLPTDSCTYGTGEETSATWAQDQCMKHMNGTKDSCYACDDCTTSDCVAGIPGCATFLSNLYDSCLAEGTNWFVVFVWICASICCLFTLVVTTDCNNWICMRYYRARRELMERRSYREEELEPNNFPRVESLTFIGMYEERNNKTGNIMFDLHFDEDGNFEGTRTKDGQISEISGAMKWRHAAKTGEVRWEESGGGVTSEGIGTISDATARAGVMYVEFSGNYVSDNGDRGSFFNLRPSHMGMMPPKEALSQWCVAGVAHATPVGYSVAVPHGIRPQPGAPRMQAFGPMPLIVAQPITGPGQPFQQGQRSGRSERSPLLP